MFGPVVWLGLSSLKTLAGIQEYPPTILPLSQIQVDVEGYDKPLPIFNVTQEDGSVKQLAQIKRIGINAKMVDPLNPGETVKVPIDKREKIREFKIQWENYVDPLRKYDFLLYFKNSTFITVVATIITLIINSMAAYALSIYEFRGKNFALVFVIGIINSINHNLGSSFLCCCKLWNDKFIMGRNSSRCCNTNRSFFTSSIYAYIA